MFLQQPAYRSSSFLQGPHENMHSILQTCWSEPRHRYDLHVLESLTIAAKSMCLSIRPVCAPISSGKSSINRINRELPLAHNSLTDASAMFNQTLRIVFGRLYGSCFLQCFDDRIEVAAEMSSRKANRALERTDVFRTRPERRSVHHGL